MNRKRIGILTGGGDVQPLNSVINSAIKSACNENIELVGFKYGWQGIIDNDFVSLNDKKINPLIGGTILKSSRLNLASLENGAAQVEENLNKINIDGLIVIGGEDTLSNSFYIKNIPQVLISKTIDNDVGIVDDDRIVNYFTLGHPSAAEKISSFVSLNEGLRSTAYSHERIIVVESMGMHAGWLALSSAMGHPDFIIIPEFPVDYEVFLEMVSRRFLESKNVIIVTAEGAKWSNGEYISADKSETDSFGHPRFKGSANLLAEKLKGDLKKSFDTRNVNSVNPSYLYRSGKPNNLDLKASNGCGERAIQYFKRNELESVFLTTSFLNNELSIEEVALNEFKNIEKLHRFVTNDYYDPETYTAAEEGKIFLSKIIPEFEEIKYGL